MVTHIKVFNHKGIEKLELKNLEKLNVICGKNSSGKSSILEGINLEDHFFIGLKISTSEQQTLCNIFAKKIKGKTTSNTVYWSEQSFSEGISQIISEGCILYKDTIESFLNKFHNALSSNSNVSSEYLIYTQGTLETYYLQYVSDIKTTLIPPKRVLESKVKIDLEKELLPNGIGVTNHLFYLKNQDLDSKDYKTYQQIHYAFQDITGFKVNIVPNKSNLLTVNFYVGNNWYTSDQCGLGLSDLLILITLVIATNYSVYLIEEPENHLHADFQKKLIRFLQKQNKQFILSTHSDVFIDINAVDRIYYAWYQNDSVNLSDQTTKSKIISDLGYSVSEKLVSDALILVEGPTDIPVIKKLLEWIGTLNDFNVKFWSLGGDIMAELDLSIFSGNENVFTIVDQDPKSKSVRDKYLRNCEEHGIKSHRLKRYSLENYLSLAAIKQVFPSQISTKIIELDTSKKVDDQLGFNKKNKTIKGKMLTTLEKMSKEDIEETDLYQFLQKIDSQLREKNSIQENSINSSL